MKYICNFFSSLSTALSAAHLTREGRWKEAREIMLSGLEENTV